MISLPTVLLVDDDPALLRLMHNWFEQHGYNLLEAANGTEALELASLYENSIDVLVTDIRMPELSGIELARRILAQRPNIRVLLISGYEHRELGWGQSETKSFAFLSKPFSREQLLTQVAQLVRTQNS